MRLRILFRLACAAVPLFGQTSTLTVTVTDPSGAGLPDATLTLRTPSGALVAEALSDASGKATLEAPRPWLFKLEAAAENFQTAVLRLPLRPGANEAEIRLEIATLTATIEIQALSEGLIAERSATRDELERNPSTDWIDKFARHARRERPAARRHEF